MYTIELRVADAVMFRHLISDSGETCWMAAGLDVLSLEGAPSAQLEQDAWYAIQNLKASKKYYESIYPDDYESVLHFLDRVIEGCQEWPEAVVEVSG